MNQLRHRFRKFSNFPLVVLCLVLLALSHGANAQQPSPQDYQDREQGITLFQQGKTSEALRALRSATRKFKDDGMAWHYLGLCLNRSGDVKGARKAFEKAVKLQPDFAPSHAALAYTQVFTNKVREAESEARVALSLDATNTQAHYILGALSLRKHACQEASTHADAAITSASGFAPAYLVKSQAIICYFAAEALKPYAAGGAVFKPSVSQESTKEERLAKAKASASRFREAADTLEKYLQLSPDASDAALWKEQLEVLRVHASLVEKPENERTIFSGLEVTTKVRVLKKPEPTYTEKARQAQVVGIVVLRAVFAADGSVENLLVINALPNGLTQAAIAAAKKIKFLPATRNGVPVSTYIQLEYNFNLY